jgi:hypothetical protein
MRGNQIRQRIEDPWAVPALSIGIHVIGNAILDDHAPGKFRGTPGGSGVVFENSFHQ